MSEASEDEEESEESYDPKQSIAATRSSRSRAKKAATKAETLRMYAAERNAGDRRGASSSESSSEDEGDQTSQAGRGRRKPPPRRKAVVIGMFCVRSLLQFTLRLACGSCLSQGPQDAFFWLVAMVQRTTSLTDQMWSTKLAPTLTTVLAIAPPSIPFGSHAMTSNVTLTSLISTR